MATHMAGTKILYSEDEKSEIQRQLERLLANIHFSNSKRFPTFLRYIIREELDARGDQIKERTLGIEVFGRDAGYDTTSDPIVRVTAAEIRKRIAQYYQELGHENELRISLPPGSYVPHFEWPQGKKTQPEAAEVPTAIASPGITAPSGLLPLVVEPELIPDVRAPHPATNHSKAPWLTALGAAALLLLATAGWLWMRPPVSALDHFWAPVLASDPVIVCFPRNVVDVIALRSAAQPEEQRTLQEQTSVLVLDDLQPLVSLSGLLETRHQRYILMGEDTATLTDLRRGPAIFLGAFDNAWTLRVTRGLRYRFGNDLEMKHFWIEDTQSPGHGHWEVDRNLQVATNNYRDYAIVARFLDSNTGKIAVVSAGIARGGTVAAGEFLTQAADMEAIKSRAPKNWDGQNMEFVLSTEIIDGRSSPPKIEATYFW
jgi:hypothetical protein